MSNQSIESHFTICHSAGFSSQVSITVKEVHYSKKKINYNEVINSNGELSFTKNKIN